MLREWGDVRAGIGEFRAALRLARQTGRAEREADVLASLAVALVYAGRTAAGLATFDRALKLSTGVQTGRVLHRRSLALLDPRPPCRRPWTTPPRGHACCERAGDALWTGRALMARGLVYLRDRLPRPRGRGFRRRRTSVRRDQPGSWKSIYDGAQPRAGRLPRRETFRRRLAYLDEAAARYRPLNVPVPFAQLDRCDVLLAAGLARDALAEADAAVREIEQAHGQSTKKAELLLIAANCALAAAQPQAALDRAQAAYRLFRAQQSSGGWPAPGSCWPARSTRTEPASAQLLRDVTRAAAQLEELGLRRRRPGASAGRAGGTGPGPPRTTPNVISWPRPAAGGAAPRCRGPAAGSARRCGPRRPAEPRRLLAACRRGLEVLDEYRFTLGASELRAQATAHGAELAVLAQRQAVRTDRPRLLLAWSERWRATALAVPAGAALRRRRTQRQPGRAAEHDQPAGGGPAPGQPRPRSWSGTSSGWRAPCAPARCGPAATPVRRRVPSASRNCSTTSAPPSCSRSSTSTALLHVLVCGSGRVRHFAAGRTEDATRAADFARFALRRLARDRPGDNPESALAMLKAAGPKLQDALLGPAARYLGDGPVVIVPPGKLHAIPWALLPCAHRPRSSASPRRPAPGCARVRPRRRTIAG